MLARSVLPALLAAFVASAAASPLPQAVTTGTDGMTTTVTNTDGNPQATGRAGQATGGDGQATGGTAQATGGSSGVLAPGLNAPVEQRYKCSSTGTMTLCDAWDATQTTCTHWSDVGCPQGTVCVAKGDPASQLTLAFDTCIMYVQLQPTDPRYSSASQFSQIPPGVGSATGISSSTGLTSSSGNDASITGGAGNSDTGAGSITTVTSTVTVTATSGISSRF